MNPNLCLRRLACLGALISGLGCASTTTSSAPAASGADVDPPALATTQPKADVRMTHTGAPELEPIYFDTDRASLRGDSRATLQEYARTIRQHPEWGTVTIDGHCDQRGSEEYNLALGDRRANVVARYLIDLGVPRDRLDTRSYGEAVPAVAGNDETAWSRNRRARLQTEALDSARR